MTCRRGLVAIVVATCWIGASLAQSRLMTPEESREFRARVTGWANQYYPVMSRSSAMPDDVAFGFLLDSRGNVVAHAVGPQAHKHITVSDHVATFFLGVKAADVRDGGGGCLFGRIEEAVYCAYFATINDAGLAAMRKERQGMEGKLPVDYAKEMEGVPMTPEQQAKFGSLALDFARKAMSEWEGAGTDRDRFYALPKAALAAYRLERYDLARDLANKSIEAAGRNEGDWNYGNALHAGHTVLGLLAVRDGNLDLAEQELLRSGAMPGSPQLNSFGPTMILARALLVAGRKKAVLAYLEECRDFWKMSGGFLDIWAAKIEAGEMPNFTLHLHQ